MLGFFTSFTRIVMSGIRPRPQDSTAWYDRAIRAGGGLFLILVMLYLLFYRG
jgi:type II secretory pathway component PulM